MELTKNDTKMIQGLSVLAMVCLHLFDKSFQGLFTPLIFIKNIPLSFYFAQISDFCVFGFAFCSGYAHMLMYKQENYYKKRLKSLRILLINFWLIVVIFSIVSVCTGHADFMPGNISDFLGTVFLYDVHYNGAWWYMWAYTLLVLLSPLILKLVEKSTVIVFLASLAIYFVSFYIRFHVNTDNHLLNMVGPFGMTLFEYVVGCLAFKIKFFTKLRTFWDKIPKIVRCCMSCAIIVILFFIRTLVIPSMLFAPISGILIITIFVFWKKPKWIEKPFLFVGKHSTNIWLTHMFFFSTLFVNFVYIAKYPPIIFAFLLLITILISIVLQFIEKPIINLINKKGKRQ